MTALEKAMTRQRVLADFGEFTLSCEDIDAVLTEACLSFLLLRGWAFLPLQGRDGRRCKLAHRATIEDGCEEPWLNTEAHDWADEAEALRETSEAVAVAERMEEVRILGRRRVDAFDAGDEAEVRRIDKALDIVGRQVEGIGN